MDRDPEGRRKRTPLGQHEQKLARPRKRGYYRRWINDVPGRIQRAAEAGYRHVRIGETEREKEQETAIVGVTEAGTPLKAYLMEQPQKYYDEDQTAKQAPLDDFDETLRRGNIVGADGKDKNSFYVPDQGISVKTGNE